MVNCRQAIFDRRQAILYGVKIDPAVNRSNRLDHRSEIGLANATDGILQGVEATNERVERRHLLDIGAHFQEGPLYAVQFRMHRAEVKLGHTRIGHRFLYPGKARFHWPEIRADLVRDRRENRGNGTFQLCQAIGESIKARFGCRKTRLHPVKARRDRRSVALAGFQAAGDFLQPRLDWLEIGIAKIGQTRLKPGKARMQ